MRICGLLFARSISVSFTERSLQGAATSDAASATCGREDHLELEVDERVGLRDRHDRERRREPVSRLTYATRGRTLNSHVFGASCTKAKSAARRTANSKRDSRSRSCSTDSMPPKPAIDARMRPAVWRSGARKMTNAATTSRSVTARLRSTIGDVRPSFRSNPCTPSSAPWTSPQTTPVARRPGDRRARSGVDTRFRRGLRERFAKAEARPARGADDRDLPRERGPEHIVLSTRRATGCASWGRRLR